MNAQDRARQLLTQNRQKSSLRRASMLERSYTEVVRAAQRRQTLY